MGNRIKEDSFINGDDIKKAKVTPIGTPALRKPINRGIEEHEQGILFYVKDSGIGIREEKQKVIFDRFMQGHESKTKLYVASGSG